ncbi:unnamed protein product [Prorocentrum cordatum]|uniref:Uncharacterized protein n=1 Tax=Prorocentrum cordatum TaxID=2364126 RepID=A0ABN9RIE1_9DINO|nr:unnamed protein product [Polarella glacialis]
MLAQEQVWLSGRRASRGPEAGGRAALTMASRRVLLVVALLVAGQPTLVVAGGGGHDNDSSGLPIGDVDEDKGGEHAAVIGEEIAKPISWVQDHGADWLLEKTLPMVAEEYRYVTMYFICVAWPLFDILVLSAAVQKAYQVGGWMVTKPLTAIRLIIVHVVPLFMIGSAAFLTPWPCCSRWQQIWQILLGMDTFLYVVTLQYASWDKELRRRLTDDGMGVSFVVLLSLIPVQTITRYAVEFQPSDFLLRFVLTISIVEAACLTAAASQ